MWRIDTCKMWSLGHFTEPPQLGFYEMNEWVHKFDEWMKARVNTLTPSLHVRHPDHHWSMHTVLTEGGMDSSDTWHQDGTSSGPNAYLGSWSNTIGTHIRVKGGRTIYQPEPCEFVLFDNHFFEHRPPYGEVTQENARNRWFVRMDTTRAIRAHPDVRECTGKF